MLVAYFFSDVVRARWTQAGSTATCPYIRELADARCERVGSDGATGPRTMVFVDGFHLRGQSPGWLRQSAATTFPYEERRL